MQPTRWVKNTLLGLIVLLIVVSFNRADLPASERVEEYIVFVLSTDFTFTRLHQQLHQVEKGLGDFFKDKWDRLVDWIKRRSNSADDSVSTVTFHIFLRYLYHENR
jgi:hypothetical protein